MLWCPDLQVYGLPFNGTRIYQRHIGKPLHYWTSTHVTNPLYRVLSPIRGIVRQLRRILCCGRPSKHSPAETGIGLPPDVHHDVTVATQTHKSLGDLNPGLEGCRDVSPRDVEEGHGTVGISQGVESGGVRRSVIMDDSSHGT